MPRPYDADLGGCDYYKPDRQSLSLEVKSISGLSGRSARHVSSVMFTAVARVF